MREVNQLMRFCFVPIFFSLKQLLETMTDFCIYLADDQRVYHQSSHARKDGWVLYGSQEKI